MFKCLSVILPEILRSCGNCLNLKYTIYPSTSASLQHVMWVMAFVVIFFFCLKRRLFLLFLIFFSLTENHYTPLSSKQLQADPAVSVKILDYDFTTAIVSCWMGVFCRRHKIRRQEIQCKREIPRKANWSRVKYCSSRTKAEWNTAGGVLKQSEILQKAYWSRVKYCRRRTEAEWYTAGGILKQSEILQEAYWSRMKYRRRHAKV